MLGLVLAFVQETLDTSIGTIEDVETYLEVPVLGIVPHIDPRETMQRLIERRPALAQIEPDALQSHALLITHFDPKSPVAEAYRTLRTNIQFARMERGGKVLVVTSPTLQEGKTTTIVNLALTMAQSGQKTLLVGANMRRPSIHRFFGIEREPGLSDILVGNAQWRDCIRTVADILMGRFEMEDIMAAPGLDNLHIIEAGPIPANPSELLSTPAMGEFLRAVRDEYDIVLIDTPPVLPVTDSAIVAGQADGVLLVYQAGKVGRLVLKRAKAHLERTRRQGVGRRPQRRADGDRRLQLHALLHALLRRGDAVGAARAGAAARRGTACGGAPGPGRRRSPRHETSAERSPRESPDLRVADVPRPVARRSGCRNVWIALAVLGGLGALFAGLAAWQMGVVGGGTTPLGSCASGSASAPAAPGASARARQARRRRRPHRPGRAAVGAGPGRSGCAPPRRRPAPPRRRRPAPRPRRRAARAAAPPPDRAAAGVDHRPGAHPRPRASPSSSGPFLTTAEAERVERQLNQAGLPTVRFRQQTGAASTRC